MALTLKQAQMQAMAAQAENTYPEECCGLLLGTLEREHDRRWVHELLPLENRWTAEVQALIEPNPAFPASTLDKRTRYWIDPKAVMEAQRYVRDRGWIILGVYHSHPDNSALPSERDRRLAWSDYSYPILSVVKGKVVDVQSWRLREDGQFQPEAIASDK
ncbi:MAG: M67 family metallopeptidase [Leptolyngbya sp. SIO1E4]|nr:M67 family metallopeptidase [Leptolyngbya sp. SIO1E4]